MAEDKTDNLPDWRSFEERVFARFDAVDARLSDMDARLQVLERKTSDIDERLQVLERKAYDTKPIWEQALKEIVDTRRELSKRLDRIEGIGLQNRADLRELEERIEKLESNPTR